MAINKHRIQKSIENRCGFIEVVSRTPTYPKLNKLLVYILLALLTLPFIIIIVSLL